MRWEMTRMSKNYSIRFSDRATLDRDDGTVAKAIMRAGTWPVTPTRGGVIPRPLRIVTSGPSDPSTGVLSLTAIERSFPLAGVPVTLSGTADDHDDREAHRVGLLKSIRLIGDRLVGRFLFTDDGVRQRVRNGSIVDVSAGIVNGVRLDHVALTNRPFLDGLGSFMFSRGAGEIVHVDATAGSVQQIRDALHGNVEDPELDARFAEAKAALSSVSGGRNPHVDKRLADARAAIGRTPTTRRS